MKMAYICGMLVLFCLASSAAENRGNEEITDLQLQRDSSSWLDIIQGKQESTRTRTFIDFIQEFLRPVAHHNGSVLQWPKDSERQEKVRRGLQKNVTRKLGCRVFYWKSWTAC